MDIGGVQSGLWPAGTGKALGIRILGGLAVRRGDVVLSAADLGGPKARQILEILVVRFGTSVSKSELVELLWGGNAPAAAVGTLESYVSVLRRALQPGQGKAGPLRTANGGYYLERSLVDTDLDRFNGLLRSAGHGAPPEAYAKLCEALALASDPLLEDELLPEWAAQERDYHCSRVTGARLLASETATRIGLTEEAVAWARLVLDQDRLNESAWTALIHALERGGRPVEGLLAYDQCRRTLDTELGCSPGPVLQGAQRRMLEATAGGSDEFSGVVAALLALHGAAQGAVDQAARAAVREAEAVVRRYLERAVQHA